MQSNDSVVKSAVSFAKISLVGKERHSGESFVDHTIKTAEILENFGVTDPTTLAAAILHHSLAHGAATEKDLEKEFGAEITRMIKILDGLRVIKFKDSPEEELAENIRKMIIAMAKDLRIVLIKLADIYENLQTINFLSEQKQSELAKETLEIFAPLAERLGMGEMKGQMQDMAFENLHPKDFAKTQKLLKKGQSQLNKTLLKIKAKLELSLKDEGIDHRIESRTKHVYSLYMKLKRPENDFDISKVFDLIAFRIIVKSEEDCYRVLGIIHKLWRPMPNKVSDFIANPKPNGYQSIHTKIFGPGEKPFEIQIRTEKMHQDAEFGIAAHWNYSEMKSRGVTDLVLTKGIKVDPQKLKWVKSLSRWQEEIEDDEEFLKSVKTDFFGQRIFVFTPKGDIKDLPIDATPVDFAYKVHTHLGDLAAGAMVNEKLVSLDTKLKNGDVCEIIISKDQQRKPNRDWLNFVVTSFAKKKIKKAYI